MRLITSLGEMFWVQWDEIRHEAAVMGTVFSVGVRPGCWVRSVRRAFMRQVLTVAVEPLGFVCAVAVFVEISVVVQLIFWLGEAGQSQLVGPLLVTVVARELAPVLINLVVIVRSASAMTNELGALKISGEIRALETQGTDPFLLLVLPRVLGTAVSTFCLTIAFIVCNEQFQSALESAIEEIRRETLLVLKKTSTGLDTWTQLGAGLGETRQHLDQLTARIENLAAGVESGKGTVGKLLTDDALADATKNLLSRANEAMSEFQGIVTNLSIASKNIQSSTTRMPEITGAVADEMKDVSGLVQQTETSMRELERLIEAMQQHWIVRKYVNRSTPPPPNEPSKTAAPGKKSVPVH